MSDMQDVLTSLADRDQGRRRFLTGVGALALGTTLSGPAEARTGDARIVFERTFAEGDLHSANDLIRTADGGFAFAGTVERYVDEYEYESLPYGWLVRTDADGRAAFSRLYGERQFFSALAQTDGGGFTLAGATNATDDGDWDALLLKTDAAGDVEWRWTGDAGDENFVTAIERAPDGGFVLAGYSYAAGRGYDGRLTKVTASGDTEWTRTYGGAGSEFVHSLDSARGGGYVLAGETDSGSDPDGFQSRWLVKTGAEGRTEFSRTYDSRGSQYVRSVVGTRDGGYALGGFEYPVVDVNAVDSVAWLLKTDGCGRREFERRYANPGDDYLWSLVQTLDGGYAFAGGQRRRKVRRVGGPNRRRRVRRLERADG